jgi:hypothetical protein
MGILPRWVAKAKLDVRPDVAGVFADGMMRRIAELCGRLKIRHIR